MSTLAAAASCATGGEGLPAGDTDALAGHVRPAVDRTLPDVDAQTYAVVLAVEGAPGRETYRAEVVGTYVATHDLTALTLDFEGNALDDVQIGATVAASRRDGAKLVVTLPRPVPAGTSFTSRVRYHGAIVQADGASTEDLDAFGGLYVKQRNAAGKRIFSSLGWPNKTRRWLPVVDHPRDGAALTMRATFPAAFTVLANGIRTALVDDAGGTRTWSYEAAEPMPPYDFHVAAYDDWTVDSAPSTGAVPIATYVYSGDHRVQPGVYRDLPRAMDFFAATFGAYRWSSASFIEEPIFGGGMENASVVSMDESLFASVPLARRDAIHELAHHWSGNLVRIRSNNDYWLSEGVTEYLTARFLGEVGGAAAKTAEFRDYLTKALDADEQTPHALRVPDPELVSVSAIYDQIPYSKGALVIRALETFLGGEEKLTAFLKGWFDRRAFSAVSTDDLEEDLVAAGAENVAPFFAGFVHGTHHPELRVTFAGVAGATDITVEQLQTKGPQDGFAFPLVVDLIDASGRALRTTIDLSGKRTKKRIDVAQPTARLAIDPDELLVGTIACGGREDGTCKAGYRCATGNPTAVCVPM